MLKLACVIGDYPYFRKTVFMKTYCSLLGLLGLFCGPSGWTLELTLFAFLSINTHTKCTSISIHYYRSLFIKQYFEIKAY